MFMTQEEYDYLGKLVKKYGVKRLITVLWNDFLIR